MRGAIADALAAHRADVWGLALVTMGLVTALAIYFRVAGPAGEWIDLGVGAAVGVMKLAVPPLLVVAGVMLLAHTDDDERGDDGVRSSVRLAIGSPLLVAVGCGLAHVLSRGPGVDDGTRALGRAGGALGVGVGGTLESLLAPWSAVLILLTVGLVGLVVVTRTPVRVAAGAAAERARPAGSWARRMVGTLFHLEPTADDDVDDYYDEMADDPDDPDDPDDDEIDEDDIDLYDQDSDADPEAEGDGEGDGEPPTKARRPPKKVRLPRPGGGEGKAEQLAIDLGPVAKGSPWKLPALSLLERGGRQQIDRRAVEEQGRLLERALAEHGVETRLVGTVVGPTVTRFELELAPGVKVSRVTSLHKDIAYAMASPDVRILAPIPGRQAIGVEVPNVDRQLVALGDILASPEARRATHPLEAGVGRDINGKAVTIDLSSMPHLLIAGATGAGKSSCLNSLLTSILMRSTPEQVRLILIDPKRVEMGQYDRLPHLLTQVVTNPKKAANALSWAVREMERRYDLLAEIGVRDITGYNAAYDRGDLGGGPGPESDSDEADDEVDEEEYEYEDDAFDEEEDEEEVDDEEPRYGRLPFVLVVIDELSDLMMVAARDVEDSVCRLAQMARAVGIHLVIATQRPSVNVITGVIKANIPARLAFAVSSATDSRVILDQMGAERLVGKGDMLLLGPASSVPRRIQGAWVGEDEARRVVGFWRRQAPEMVFDESVQSEDEARSGSGSRTDDEDDELLWQAMELVVRGQLGSTSMLQRKLRVGFARAGRLMDLLEQRGVVGPSEGSKARTVLMTPEELDDLLSGQDA